MRLELFFKSIEELELLADFLNRTPQISSINLTNKRKDENMFDWVQLLRGKCPQIDVCPHFSIKNQYQRSEVATLRQFADFDAKMRKLGVNNVLIVSGGGAKRKLDTIALLRACREPQNELGVAFNPYFPLAADMAEERRRLVLKLKTGKVKSVWLQFGSDVAKLEAGLSWLTSSEEMREFNVQIIGSVFIPSNRLLSQMSFRPWNGVFLNEEFLSSVEAADLVVRKIVQLYTTFSVEPLVETAVKSRQDMQRVQELLGSACTERVNVGVGVPTPGLAASDTIPTVGSAPQRDLVESWFAPTGSTKPSSPTPTQGGGDLAKEVSQIRRRCAAELSCSLRSMGLKYTLAQCESALHLNQDNPDRAINALLSVEVGAPADEPAEQQQHAVVAPSRNKPKTVRKRAAAPATSPIAAPPSSSASPPQAPSQDTKHSARGTAVDRTPTSKQSPMSTKRQRQNASVQQQQQQQQKQQQQQQQQQQVEVLNYPHPRAMQSSTSLPMTTAPSSALPSAGAPFGKCVILWFRQDLRLVDNPALIAAANSKLTVIPVFVWSPEEEGRWGIRGAR
jgi:hypothetical protein